jgi:hypothetical protein
VKDARLLNWRFIAPQSDGRVLLLPVEDEHLLAAVVPDRDRMSLSAALDAGPYSGVVAPNLSGWTETAGMKPAALLSRLAASVSSDGWIYVGFTGSWYPMRPFATGSMSLRSAISALNAAGLSEIVAYFALPDQRCPAYLIPAGRRDELDYFLRQLFFPYAEAATPFRLRIKQGTISVMRHVALKSPHWARLRFSPAIAIVAKRYR